MSAAICSILADPYQQMCDLVWQADGSNILAQEWLQLMHDKSDIIHSARAEATQTVQEINMLTAEYAELVSADQELQKSTRRAEEFIRRARDMWERGFGSTMDASTLQQKMRTAYDNALAQEDLIVKLQAHAKTLVAARHLNIEWMKTRFYFSIAIGVWNEIQKPAMTSDQKKARLELLLLRIQQVQKVAVKVFSLRDYIDAINDHSSSASEKVMNAKRSAQEDFEAATKVFASVGELWFAANAELYRS